MSAEKDKNFEPLFDIMGRFTPYIYILPTLAITSLFLIYPFVNTFFYSLLKWDGIGEMSFLGITNYINIFQDPKFWASFNANLIYIVMYSIIPVIAGLVVSSLIGRTELFGVRFFRTVFFLPQVIASVAIGIIFSWIYSSQFGVINQILGIIGLDKYQTAWFGHRSTAPYAVGFIGIWLTLGFAVIIFLSGIQKIDESIYEAAKIDGANSTQQFLYITLPELRYEMVVVFVVTLIRSLSTNIFGIVSSTTGGSYGTRPISLYAYDLAFVQYELGYASALVVILVILILVLTQIIERIGEGR